MIYMTEESKELLVAITQMMDERFDKVDERLDKMDERFDKIDERLDKMDERFDKIDERLDKMDERFDKIDERFEQVDEMEGRLVLQWNKDIHDSENLLLEEMESNYKKIEEHYVKKEEIA